MIVPVKLDGNITFLTRAGYQDACMSCRLCLHLLMKYAALNKYLLNTNHEAFADEVISHNKTPIFEYVAKYHPLRVKYPENSLILVAIRNNLTGSI